MAEFRILDFNFVQEDNVGVSASSEDTEFPAINVAHEFRSKVWRSSGNFVIDATNNKIDFNEGAGELTATLTSGTFTPTTLASEIKTQLEAVGANTYTITFSSTTGLWTFASGGPTFSLLWSSGTNTAVSVGPSLGFAITDQTGSLSYTAASIALHTEEFVQIDIKTTEAIDSAAIVFDSRAGIKLSEEAVVKLQANATTDFSSPSVNVTLSVDNQFEVFTHFFTADQSFRYWRINIVDPKNANLFIELGNIILSKGTTIEQGPEVGFSYTTTDTSIVQRNRFGNEYIDEYPNIAKLSLDFKAILYTTFKTVEEIYRRVGKRTPVVVAIDTDETVFDKDNFFIYGKIGNFTSKHVSFNIFDFNLTINEMF